MCSILNSYRERNETGGGGKESQIQEIRNSSVCSHIIMFLYGTVTMKSHKNVPNSFDTSFCLSIPSTENIAIEEIQKRFSLTFRYLQVLPKIC